VLPVRLRPAAGGVPPPAARGDAGAGLSKIYSCGYFGFDSLDG
jgi:hypothetical protein